MGSGKTPCMLGTLDKQYHDGCKRNDDGPSKILVEEFPAAIWHWPSRCRDFALMSIWGNYKHVVPGPQEIWPTDILCASHLRQLCAGISRGALCWSLRTTQRRWRGMIDVDFHPCGNIYIYKPVAKSSNSCDDLDFCRSLQQEEIKFHPDAHIEGSLGWDSGVP